MSLYATAVGPYLTVGWRGNLLCLANPILLEVSIYDIMESGFGAGL